MTAPGHTEPQQAFAELGRIRLTETTLDGVLAKVAELAKRSLAGTAEASVTLIDSRRAHTAAHTGDLALTLDEFQYGAKRGPCLDAAASAGTLSIADTHDEPRWADYARRAVEAGVRSSLAIGLPVQEAVTGALNLYAAEPHAYGDDAVMVAQTFAGYAAVALANAHSYDATATLARQMREAMEHRAVIEQAKGIVMAERRCAADEAFAFLSRESQETNRKLRDVAATLVERTSTHR